jgi:hypothetical protein
MANISITNYSAYDGIKPKDTEQAVLTGLGADAFIRGTLLGRITATEKYYVYNVANTPAGTGTIVGVLLNAVTTTDTSDYPIGVMLTGEIDEDILMIDGGTQGENITEAIKDTLRGLGIIVKSPTESGVIDNPQS